VTPCRCPDNISTDRLFFTIDRTLLLGSKNEWGFGFSLLWAWTAHDGNDGDAKR
jgi:hypothetical protein